jgi:pimeloyl-ACP methyl ester carboxylesterase
MPLVDAPGLRIHYEAAGTGPNIFVLVHGNFASWRWWKPVFERLPPGFRAYAPDLRSCGATAGGASVDDYSIPQLSSDLLAFADALELRSFHLVGHSLGGAIALQFALEHSDRLRSLALVSPAPATGLAAMREGDSDSAALLRQVDPENGASMAVLQSSYRVHRMMGTNRVMLRSALAEMMPSATIDHDEFELLLADAARMPSHAVVGFLRALHGWNVEARLRDLRTRTLIISGGKDVVVPAAALKDMARRLPRGRLVAWPDVGHSPQIERPDEFVRLVVASAQRSPVTRIRTWLWRAGRALLLRRTMLA